MIKIIKIPLSQKYYKKIYSILLKNGKQKTPHASLRKGPNYKPRTGFPCTNFWRSGTFGAKEKPQDYSKKEVPRVVATNGNNALGEASSQGAYRPESIEP